MLSAVNLTTFMCQWSCSLGASNFWNPQGLSRPVTALLCSCLVNVSSRTAFELFSEFVLGEFQTSEVKDQRALNSQRLLSIAWLSVAVGSRETRLTAI